MVEFDDSVNVDVIGESPMKIGTVESWWTGGSTALLDAIGKSISIGERLLKETKAKDQSVLVLILSDGEENASVEWEGETLKEKMKNLEETNLWTFTFIGGSLQVKEMHTLGFTAGNTMSCSFTTNSMSHSSTSSLNSYDVYNKARLRGATSVKDYFKGDK